MMNSKAFSLIELMVVIAIVGVLAAIAVPSYKSYLIKTNIANGLNLFAPLQANSLDQHNKGFVYGQTNGTVLYPYLGSGNPPNIVEASVTWYGCVEVDYNLQTLGLTTSFDRLCLLTCPIDNGSSVVTWTCGYHTGCNTTAPVLSYLPANCQTPMNLGSTWVTSY